jgi:regulator of protease activity HflC (stomatin/prohibitin superfamily)
MTAERQLIKPACNTRARPRRSDQIKSAADRQAAETIANAMRRPRASVAKARPSAAQVLPVFQQNPELANYLLRIDALNSRSTKRRL